jgi:hypothetical protein
MGERGARCLEEGSRLSGGGVRGREEGARLRGARAIEGKEREQ